MNSDALIARARITEGLQALPRHELKRLWADLGYIILPAAPEWHDRPETALQTERLIAAIVASLAEDFASVPALAKVSGTTIECIVRDFYELAPNSPVNAKKGGNGFNGCLQVYAVARSKTIPSGIYISNTSAIAISASFTFIMVLPSPGSMAISSFTMAAHALDVSHAFTNFLLPTNVTCVSFAFAKSSGPEMINASFPVIVPFTFSLISLMVKLFIAIIFLDK